MEKLNSKKIVLAITQDMLFYECFVKELKKMGYEVVLLLGFSERLISKKDKKINSVLKFISPKLKEKRLKNLHKRHDLINVHKLEIQFKYDKGLVIRPDLFSDFLLKRIKTNVHQFVAYQWDGMKRYKGVEDKVPFFDRFYVFDKSDQSKFKGTIHSRNFYFDSICEKLSNSKIEYDIYYLGSYDKRIDEIINLCSILDGKGFKLNIKIPCSKKRALNLSKYPFIDTTKKKYTYLENLEMASKAKVILDFGHKELHQGLSFRTFEALGLGKKLISTNLEINNLDVTGYLYLNDLNSDVRDVKLKEYCEDSDVLKVKCNGDFSFTNWFKSIYS